MDKLLSQSIWKGDVPWHFEFRNPQPPFPLHSHNFHEIAVVYSGKGCHILPSGVEEIKAGDVISIKPGQVHGFSNVENLILMNILIRPGFLSDSDMQLYSLPGYKDLFQPVEISVAEKQPVAELHLNTMQLFEARALIESMQNEISKMYLGWMQQSISYLYQLLVFLLRIYENPSFPDSSVVNVSDELVKYVGKNFAKELSMQDLIDRFNLSESSILRIFKRITGYPPFEYQMRQRVFAAQNELVSSDSSITKIAYDVGFNDSNYFSRCFKKIVNMTPRNYREQFKEI